MGEQKVVFITERVPRGAGAYDAFFFVESEGCLYDILGPSEEVSALLVELYHISGSAAYKIWLRAKEAAGVFAPENKDLAIPHGIPESMVRKSAEMYKAALRRAMELARATKREEEWVSVPA